MNQDDRPMPADHGGRRARPSAQGMSAARALVWFHRTLGMLALAVVIFAVAIWFDLPHAWIGPVFVSACAEVTRRICAESNPSVPLRWRDIFRLLRDPAGAPLGREADEKGAVNRDKEWSREPRQ